MLIKPYYILCLMIAPNPVERGPLLRRIIRAEPELDLPYEWLLTSSNESNPGISQAEVYYLHEEVSPDGEPGFYMATSDDIFIQIAVTGEPTDIRKVTGSRNNLSLETVVERDPQGTYHLNRQTLPVDGVANNPNKRGEQLLELLVDYVCRTVDSVRDPEARNMAKNFQSLTYNALMARFNSLKTMQTLEDIVPDQSPRTLVVKAGEGCIHSCSYCKLSGVDFRPYTIDEFVQHLTDTNAALLATLGREGMQGMTDGFINISDILLLDLYKKQDRTDLTAKKAAALMRKEFPWLEKIGSFVGSLSALQLSRNRNGYHELGNQHYSEKFFERLCGDGEGIVRLYLGLETAHTAASALLGKRITYEQKMMAAQLIKSARIGLKVIVQLGVLGKQFYPIDADPQTDRPVPWYRATDETIRWLNEAQPYRIMESVWQNYDDLPINRLITDGRIVPYDNPIRQIQTERRRLRNGIKIDWRRANDQVIEPTYEKFLPPGERKLVVVH